MLEIIIVIAGVLNLIMGVVVLLGNTESAGKYSFVLFSIVSFFWAICVFFIHRTSYSIFVTLSYSVGALFMTFLLSWAYHFSGENRFKFRSFYIYIVGAIFVVMPFIDGLVVNNIQKVQGNFVSDDGPLYMLFLNFSILTYVFVLWNLVYLYRKSADEKKFQARTILAGFSIYGILSLFLGLILPIFNYDKLIDFDVPSSMIFIAFTSYAIVKYKWMNIKIIAVQLLSVLIVGMALANVFNSNNRNEVIYNIFSLVILLALSVMLVRSVMNEVRRKEELQVMADKLAMANDALRKLDNAKTEFLSIASHQLRTPLTAIKGFVSLLLEGSYGELKVEQKAALEKVYSSGERLIQLVEDLLNVSRIESGRMQFVIENSDMTKLLKELYENFLLVAKTKNFYLDLKLPKEGLPEIPFDYSKVRELISNFIDNALKYTEKGGVTVTAEKRDAGVMIDEKGFVIPDKVSPYGHVLRVTVSDTGIGVPPEEIPYLFKKFSRGKDVSRLHVGGTGLGLYVGKAIADAHHGAVWVESDGAGKGSRFIIEIPTKSE